MTANEIEWLLDSIRKINNSAVMAKHALKQPSRIPVHVELDNIIENVNLVLGKLTIETLKPESESELIRHRD